MDADIYREADKLIEGSASTGTSFESVLEAMLDVCEVMGNDKLANSLGNEIDERKRGKRGPPWFDLRKTPRGIWPLLDIMDANKTVMDRLYLVGLEPDEQKKFLDSAAIEMANKVKKLAPKAQRYENNGKFLKAAYIWERLKHDVSIKATQVL